MKRKKANSGFLEALLSWYHLHKRNLPWRHSRDPYVIWISEIMLQQTQVKTALPYFEKFLKKFPDLKTLAKAPVQEILKSWEGLGYYKRAHHLHSTACEIQANYGGKFPSDSDSLQTLPGIGLYTANAIASMAFGQAVPVVDGNVWRVFSRILMDGSTPEKGKKNVYAFLKKLIPSENPSWFNQAIMELGSLVCLPKNPRCSICPVLRYCKARKENSVSQFPKKPKKKFIRHESWGTLVAIYKGKVLLQERPFQGVWGGLWIFPSVPIHGTKNPEKELQDLVAKLSLPAGAFLKPLKPVPHAFSHFRLTLHPFCTKVTSAWEKDHYAWMDPKNNPYPVPRPYFKMLQALGKGVSVEKT